MFSSTLEENARVNKQFSDSLTLLVAVVISYSSSMNLRFS